MRIGTWLALILALAPASVEAGVVFTIPGIEDLEWLELTETEGYSRNVVEAQLGPGGLWEGWRYATRAEVETLYDALWGGTNEGWHQSNYAGANEFFDAFGIGAEYDAYNNGGYDPTGFANWDTFFGEDGECNPSSAWTCDGGIGVVEQAFGGVDDFGRFNEDAGLSFGLGATNGNHSNQKTSNGLGKASHLVRLVPEPGAALSLSGGCALLCWLHRRRRSTRG